MAELGLFGDRKLKAVFAKNEHGELIEYVPVVRCKDCWKSADGLCSYQMKNVPGKDFCGDGERKDNEY